MKKTSLAISMMLVFSLIVVVSCRKEVFLDYIFEKMSDEDPFVREARLSFQEEYGKKKIKFRSSVASVAPDRDRKITINIQPAWSFAKKVNTPKLQGVEVPVLESIASRKMFNYDKVHISPEDNKLRARNSFKRLLYYKTSNGKSFNIVLTYLPDLAYVKKFSGRISKGSLNMRTVKSTKYSGYIEYARLDGRGIFVLQFKEGKVVRRHTYKYKKSVELPVSNVVFKSSSSNGAVENGGTSAPMASAMWGDTEQCEDCVPIEIRVCAGELEEEEVEDEDCGEWTDSGQEECTPIECPEEPGDEEDGCWPHCDDPCYDEVGYYICDPWNPDPDNPDGPEDPNEPEDPWWDCAGIKFGSAYLCPDGTCIGGTTGLWDCEKLEIKDSLDSFECAKSLINPIFDLKNSIADLLNEQFNDPNIDYEIYFRAQEPGVGSMNDSTDGYWNNNNNSGTAHTITLNAEMLRKASKEYILVTMYHEALHAYIYSLKESLGWQFSVLYPEVSEVYMGGMPKYLGTHSQFGSFLTGLADAIQSFNPNISRYDAEVMAKTGILNPSSVSQVDRIINEKYRNGKLGTSCE